MNMKYWFTFVICLCVVGGCAGPGPDPFGSTETDTSLEGEEGSEFTESGEGEMPEGGNSSETEGDVESDDTPECNSSWLPIVAAHGYLASGDTYAQHTLRFLANGHCPGSIYVFDWNTLDQSVDHAAALDVFIDDVLVQWDVSQVHLMGHSAGGGLGYSYLSEPERAAKVAQYVHIASFVEKGPAGPEGEIPTLNLYSTHDLAIEDKGDIPGATNILLQEEDHYEVATSEASFEAIFTFLHEGESPDLLSPVEETEPSVSGKMLTFGENQPVEGTLSVFPVDGETGARISEESTLMASVSENGVFDNMEIDGDLGHEFLVEEAGDIRPIHYYFPPMPYSNPFVYLRTLPPPGGGSVAGLLTSLLPFDDERALLVVFSSNRAMIAGEDSLLINGAEVLTAETAPEENTTIAMFFYDGNTNGESDKSAIGIFGGFPFISGVDFAFPSGDEHPIKIVLKGRTIVVPGWPSDTDGPSVVVFD